MVELIHQKLHSSRANLRNRSASVMFLGIFLYTNSKIQIIANSPFIIASKEKDYSGFCWSRHFTVFATEFRTNRGLFISVHSVWYIYYIGLYYTAFWDSHFLLTRVHFHDSSHQRIVVHGCAFFSFVLPLKMICGTSITLFAHYCRDYDWITFFEVLRVILSSQSSSYAGR